MTRVPTAIDSPMPDGLWIGGPAALVPDTTLDCSMGAPGAHDWAPEDLPVTLCFDRRVEAVVTEAAHDSTGDAEWQYLRLTSAVKNATEYVLAIQASENSPGSFAKEFVAAMDSACAD